MLDTLRPESDDPRENMKAIHLIQVLYDDIVLRLWKFIDSDPRTNGGRPLIERLRQSTVVDESRLVAAEAALGRRPARRLRRPARK